MRHLLALAVVAALLSFPAIAAPTVGQPAPAFAGTDVLSGKEITLESLKGKTVVIEWNNFGCPFVKKFYGSGNMQGLQSTARKDGIVWVTVNSSAKGKEGHFATAEEAKAAVAENKVQSSAYILDHDGVIGHAYGAASTPHMFVINKAGTLAYAGAIDDKPSVDPADIAAAKNYVTAALDDLRAGRAVTTPSTQAYGCFVKY